MDEGQNKRAELVIILNHCSEALADRCSSNAPLRQLQHLVRSLLYVGSDSYLRTIAFILDEWIKDYYLNFAGDIMTRNWSQVDAIRTELLSGPTSTALAKLSEAVSAGSQEAFSAIEQLVVSYLDAIEKANLAIKQ